MWKRVIYSLILIALITICITTSYCTIKLCFQTNVVIHDFFLYLTKECNADQWRSCLKIMFLFYFIHIYINLIFHAQTINVASVIIDKHNYALIGEIPPGYVTATNGPMTHSLCDGLDSYWLEHTYDVTTDAQNLRRARRMARGRGRGSGRGRGRGGGGFRLNINIGFCIRLFCIRIKFSI